VRINVPKWSNGSVEAFASLPSHSPSQFEWEHPPERRLPVEGYKIPRLARVSLSFLSLSFSSLLVGPVCTFFQDIFIGLLAPLYLIEDHLRIISPLCFITYLLSSQSIIAMATQRHYYQPAAYPYHTPSKAPTSAALYPISRVAGSPPDYSDASTTGGSRSSGGLTFSSAGGSGDYESSPASYSGVDVVDVLNHRMQDAYDPTPLDRGLARQAQT
jgi:hypothetical protein